MVPGSPIGTESGFLAVVPQDSEGAESESLGRGSVLILTPLHPIFSVSLLAFVLVAFFLPLLPTPRLIGVSCWASSGLDSDFCFWFAA